MNSCEVELLQEEVRRVKRFFMRRSEQYSEGTGYIGGWDI